MKSSRSTNSKQNKQGLSKKPKPEIRDDMDSRERKESTRNSSKKAVAKRKKSGSA